MKKIGISIGDVNGIGPEVIIKTLQESRVLKHCIPIVYGSSKVLSYHKNVVKAHDFVFRSTSSVDRLSSGTVYVVNCWEEAVKINLGEVSKETGKLAYIALDRAAEDLKSGAIDGLVTAPINKKSMQLADFPHRGHTEFLTQKAGVTNSLMMLISEEMKMALATTHIPISEVSSSITKELLKKKISILHKTMVEDFGVEKPIIALLGLNPHAGDEGTIGTEEEEIVRPLIIEAKKKNILLYGPYSADGFFGSNNFRKYDAILSMYHDQGLIPFKALSFGNGTNFTAGLPFVRTSPDHGTGFDIAGKNLADPSSFREALYRAINIIDHREEYQKGKNSQIEIKPKPSEEAAE